MNFCNIIGFLKKKYLVCKPMELYNTEVVIILN